MKVKTLITVVITLCLGSYFAWAKLTSPAGDQNVSYIPSKKECFDGNPEKSWRYCVHVPQVGETNGNVAYLLHGRNLDENTWNDDTFYTAMIQNYWQSRKITPPIVVTVSFGPVWLLVEKGKAQKSGLLDTFQSQVIPEVETRIGVPKKRILFGESMGGLNTLIVGLKVPTLFQQIASMCPGVYSLSTFASLTEIDEFLKRTGADPKIIYGVIQLAKDYVEDESEWASASPLNLIDSVEATQAPEIYMSCGLYDAYGNFEGSERLAIKAQARGIKISWRPIYGGHCAMDVASLAEFLAKQ